MNLLLDLDNSARTLYLWMWTTHTEPWGNCIILREFF